MGPTLSRARVSVPVAIVALMFDAAIFDFGGVLTSPIRESFARFEASLGLPEFAILQAFTHGSDGQEPSFFKLERGEIGEGEFYSDMKVRLESFMGRPVDLPDDPVACRERMFGSIGPNQEMIEAAHAINQHYTTGILTNNVKEWSEWREWVGAHAFDDVIDSSEVGMRKPEERIYRLTCERLGVDPARAVFIDDIQVNVEGAAAIGMRAIQFTSTEDVLAELQTMFPRAFNGNGR